MNVFDKFVRILTLRTSQIAQAALAFAMIIIVANVISRRWGIPVPGTVELVEMSGAILLAMAVAYTAMLKGHIMVSFFVDRYSLRTQGFIDFVVSAISIYFVFILSRETFVFAARMMQRGYSTGHLHLPIAPSIYLVAFGFAMLTLVLFRDIIKAVIMIYKGSEKV